MNSIMTQRFKSRFGISDGTTINRILITRTCRMEAFKEIVVDLQSHFPEAELYCITNTEALETLQEMDIFEKIYTYELNPFKLRAFDSVVKREMEAKCFDLCVLPYNNYDGAGYADWRTFLLQMGAKYCFGCDGRLGNRFAREFKGGRFGHFTEVEYIAKDIRGTIVSTSLFCAFVGLLGAGLVIKNVLKPIEPSIEKVYWKIVRSLN